MAPLMANDHLNYTARVEKVIPVSKRNKHAKSAVVAVEIDAEYSEKEIPVEMFTNRIEDKKVD